MLRALALARDASSVSSRPLRPSRAVARSRAAREGAATVSTVRGGVARCARSRARAERSRALGVGEPARDDRRDVRARGKISEDDQDEDDRDQEAGAGGVEGWHGEFKFANLGKKPTSKRATEAEKKATVRELLLSRDPGLNQTLISSGTSVSQLFDQDKWERHRMVDRFIVELLTIPQSTVFSRLLKPCTALAMYTAFVVAFPSIVAYVCAQAHVAVPFPQFSMSQLTLPASAHSLLGTLCGLVLVFRTNSSYARFVEGRTAWGALIRHCRDVARLSMYIPDKKLRRRLLELCTAYAYVLKARLRSGRTRSDPNDPTAFRDVPDESVRRCVTEPALAEQVLSSVTTGNRCLYTLLLISKTLKASLAGGLPREVHWNIEECVSNMGLAGGICERIIATPIPLSFSRHTARSLVIWLLTLPFVIVPAMGWLSVPCIFTLAYLVLGIDEIGIQIEEPFATLPLTPLCAVIERDMSIAIADMDASVDEDDAVAPDRSVERVVAR